MEGYPANPLVPPGYINSSTAYYFEQPQITQVLTTPAFVYVSPEGSDDPANVGSVTSPFATISNALFYVTTVSPIFPVPLSSPVCIFVAPGIYAGGFSVPDNVYLIGPSNSPVPVVITSSIFVSPVSSSSTIGITNITLQALEVAGAVYDVNLEVNNCIIQTETIFAGLTIAPLSVLINVNVYMSECVIRAIDENNANLIFADASELVTLTLDNCEVVSEAEEGDVISVKGNLTIRNSSVTNTAASTTLRPLLVSRSGTTLTPVVNLEGSIFKYADVQTDVGGDKRAIRFDAPTQPITAKMTNCTISVHLGGGNTDIVDNIGAANVTFTQATNSCLEDGITIDTTNIVLPAAFFLQDSPLPPPPSGGVTFLNSLAGAITLDGAGGVSVGSLGSTITITGTPAPVDSVGAKTGAVTFATGSGVGISYGVLNADPITISNTGVLSVSPGTGTSVSTTTGVATVTSIARTYTLGGATTAGVITYTKASGAGNTWTSSTWTLMNTIQINVPPGWDAGQSVGFDGYEYINWDSNTTSYYTIYYVTPSQPVEESLIGDRTAGFTDAIFGNNSGQAYLPLNLTIPPTYLASGGTITLRIYGYVTAALHYMVSDPLIDARVNIAYP